MDKPYYLIDFENVQPRAHARASASSRRPCRYGPNQHS